MHYRKLIRKTLMKKRCTLPKAQQLCTKKCSHRNTHLTDLSDRTPGELHSTITGISCQYDFLKCQSGVTISQLLQYNSYHGCSSGEVKRERRNKSRKTPLPIFVGLSIHQPCFLAHVHTTAKTMQTDILSTN